jgi:TonB family protein
MKLAMLFPPQAEAETPVLPVALTVAIAVHAAIGVYSAHAPPARPVAPSMVVDLTIPMAAPAPVEIPKPEPEVKEAKPEEKALAAPRTASPAAKAPAAAGKLLTAAPTADTDAPVDFVTDPNGSTYGFGVVAKGGTAPGEGVKAVAVTNQQTTARVAAATTGTALVSSSDLSEQPHLVADDPCRGYYPGDAIADSASATVRVVLSPEGRVQSLTLVGETPSAQGFGRAATQCLRAQRFTSARDRTGHTVATSTTVRVRFHR